MQRLTLGALVALTLVTAGCLGSVNAAEVPASTLDDEGWQEERRASHTVAMGLAQAVLVDYVPRNSAASFTAGVTAATANDVPLFDESTLVPEALERIEEQHDVRFEEIGERSIELTNEGTTVTATQYRVEGAPADARALVFEVACEPYVAVAAFGATDESGLFGGGQSPYQDALDVAAAVTC